ncbi:MAG: VacB/RNase II family 3'-5' exoribonuclease [Kiritimatiellae bacterium]|nr:VacB/RNase II family 3'-5' exoribonuclease [Kiritimatiellia bacterium]
MNKNKLLTEAFRDRVMGLFQSPGSVPLTADQIAVALALHGPARKQVGTLLEWMVRNGEIVRIRRNHYSLGKPADLITGQLDILRSGNGIVQPLDGSVEIFVARDDVGTAMPSDRVVVRLDPGQVDPETRVRRTGKVINILERSRRAIAGTLKATPRFHYVVPIDPAYSQDFYVSNTKGARVGDRVVIQFTEWPNKHVSPEAEIIEVIGPESDPSLDTLTIIRHYSLRDTFPAEVIREAEASPDRLANPGDRRDFRDRFIFTIDPTTSRDYDDALSLVRDARGRRVLGVHIADVAHFVRAGGPMDHEARIRGNSVYLPDKVLPMLPEQLSNGLCSLRPDEDRMAFSVLITFGEDGVPVHSEFCKSLIRSRLRLTYEQALALLQSQDSRALPETAKVTPDQRAVLIQIHRLAQQMRQRRFAQYALDLDMPEYEVIMGPDGMIVDIRQNLTDISHALIEECMVAANEAVDRELSTRGFELIHRVHESPAPEKLEILAAQLADMGFHPGDLSKRKNITDFLVSVRGQPLEYDAKLATLKSMKRALYSPLALGHYGLAKKFYAHFTSPIRRYPDLVVHRILQAMLTQHRSPYAHGDLSALSLSCSRTEQVAETAEKNLLEIKKYRFLEQQIARKEPKVYDAIVVRVKNFGLFVELTRLQVQGLVHVSTLSREFVRYDERRQVLRAGKITFTLGDRLRVFVARVDFDKRQIDFAVADDSRIAGAAAAAPKSRPSGKEHGARRRQGRHQNRR